MQTEQTVTYSRDDLFRLMLDDAGISVDVVLAWHSNEDGSITAKLPAQSDAPAASVSTQ